MAARTPSGGDVQAGLGAVVPPGRGRSALPLVRRYPQAVVFIDSPYVADAHYARKYTTSWVGYKVHVSKACNGDAPPLSTHVDTTGALAVDTAALPAFHQSLHRRELLPAIQLVDAGYLNAPQFVAAQGDRAVEPYGPARPDNQ